MINYNNSKIYKLINSITGLIYIGSTTRSLENRLSSHVSDYKRYQAGKTTFITSYLVLEGGNYSIELIEEYPCESSESLKQREGYYIRQMTCVNKNIAGRNDRDYYSDNKDRIMKYRSDHISEYKQYQQEWRESNKEYNRDWKKKNQEKIKQSFDCLCGGHYTLYEKPRHEKTMRHINYIKSI